MKTYIRYSCGCGDVVEGRVFTAWTLQLNQTETTRQNKKTTEDWPDEPIEYMTKTCPKKPCSKDFHKQQVAYLCSQCQWCDTWVVHKPGEQNMPLCARCSLIAKDMKEQGLDPTKCSRHDAATWERTDGELAFLDRMIEIDTLICVCEGLTPGRGILVWIENGNFHAAYLSMGASEEK